ncbi:beta-1,6-galactofuranosyltransferase [Ligilactobacillus sp. WILCCON 0076]|uniref:Beta-1,6-galactofuranosyltransferase n=1 Tax=Ligilactobacillus ubinensis TaxID=2876789 RepID=A0A9X2FL91_9LACO|nr:beta-1,6-galactofuranosyltransferase [Ligilactobacillus ubinensis]MCP0887612.1 beta-1,6-galactofuranosyltransferase [Ligilactobacillus ubinensis]
MNNIILTSLDPGKNTGGVKAKIDIINFLKEHGYTSYEVNPYVSKLKKAILANITIPKDINRLSPDKVIIQYPIPSEHITRKIIECIRKKKDSKIVFLIHDIQGLQSTESETIVKELKIFDLADEIIVHNKHMGKWLQEKGCQKPLVDLEVFDYANPQPINKAVEYNRSICFAGNLFKSEFLKDLDLKHGFYAFGPNMFSEYPSCIEYCGQYSPEELPAHLNQNFGLIWDGPSIKTCKGTYGNYLRYNNPHKTSLYISSGIPIIIWKKAALADFVLDNKIGIAIDSLNELDSVLDSISEEQYQQIKSNTREIAQKLREGYYTKKAADSVN